jgi:hypothetical protein
MKNKFLSALRGFTVAAIVAAMCLGAMDGIHSAVEHNLIAPSNVLAQSITSLFPNSKFPPMVFTATSQTKKQTLGGFSTATLEITGTATSCILQVEVSNDGGSNYFATPYFAGVYTSNVPVIVTGAAFPTYNNSPVLYWISVAGMTNLEVVSSGTFTGTSCTVQITASSNKYLP